MFGNFPFFWIGTTPKPTPTSTLPAFPLLMFPNIVTVYLANDDVGGSGGANPNPVASLSFPASVQSNNPRWDGSGATGRSIAETIVKFQVNPDLTLSRSIQAGDQLLTETGAILNVLGRTNDSGGYAWLFGLRCEWVTS